MLGSTAAPGSSFGHLLLVFVVVFVVQNEAENALFGTPILVAGAPRGGVGLSPETRQRLIVDYSTI